MAQPETLDSPMSVEEDMRTSNALHVQKSMVCEVRLHYVDLYKRLSKVNLKLKIRVNGKTSHKTKPQKGAPTSDGPSRIHINTIRTLVCEEGDLIQFELCRPCLLGASHTVACCVLPIETALSDMVFLCLDLYAQDHPHKVLAHLMSGISVKASTLDGVSGAKILKSPTATFGTGEGDACQMETVKVEL